MPVLRLTAAVALTSAVILLGTAGTAGAGASPDNVRHNASLTFSSISDGTNETCGIETGGSAICWGNDTAKEAEPPVGPFSQIEAGNAFSAYSCGILASNSSIKCWGQSFAKKGFPAGAYSQLAGQCALTTAGAVKCANWTGGPHSRPSKIPAGPYSQLATTFGNGYSCGLKTTGVIACWDGNYGISQVLPGPYTYVSAGGGDPDAFGCGIRNDETISCWGAPLPGFGQAPKDVPSGTFTQLATGYGYACGLRTDGTVDCWTGLKPKSPSGTFTSITSGYQHACGIRTDGTALCWGVADYGQNAVPTDMPYTQVSAGEDSVGSFTTGYACGVHADGSITCLGDYNFAAPAGTYSEVSAGEKFACGLHTDGTVSCFGKSEDKDLAAPSGTFTQVSAGWFFACGVTTTGTAKCWGLASNGETRPPATDTFSEVSAGYGFACGLLTSGSIVCWGSKAKADTKVPTGTFTAVSAGWFSGCGLMTTGAIKCWGKPGSHATKVPAGTYSEVSAGNYFACGVRLAGSAVCWGNNKGGQKAVPSGTFTSLSAGSSFVSEVEHGGFHDNAGFACGIRNGALNCWGSLPTYNP